MSADAHRRQPLSTYRVQLHPGFNFEDAAGIASYMADLGVTHLYSSPYLKAAPGSTHGYDVVDHTRVNEELGGAEGHDRLCSALGEAGLGQVLDIVPNHMAITGGENRWWWDVLENGPSSLYASYFDVDWNPPEAKLLNTVLMPILGDHYGRVLEAGQFRVTREGGSFTLHYYEHRLPVAPRSLDKLLFAAAQRCGSAELEFIANSYYRLPHSSVRDRESVRERHRDKEVLRSRLDQLCAEDLELAKAIDSELERLNSDYDELDDFLERQNYRLAFWRTARRELDYRRFFDISTLVGLRTEDYVVFRDTHALVLDWLRRGVIDGLRIDHIDGLRDPAQYLQRLSEASEGAWVVVEKILEPGEQLGRGWPVAGTTGYDFLNLVGGLFVDPTGQDRMTSLYAEVTSEPCDYADVAHEKKHLVMREVLGADLNRLTALFVEVCECNRRYRDFTRHDLHEVLREVIACFPVYRTYVDEAGNHSDEDVARVEAASTEAAQYRPDLDCDLLEFLRGVLLAAPSARGDAERELRMRFQQVTGPVMAKGVEDTAFYTFNRLVSLNEVGGDPSRFRVSTEEFHQEAAAKASKWPTGLTALSTHDTKRSEDVRARLALLSEIPDSWGRTVWGWMARNDQYRSGGLFDRNAEYLFYQVLVGAHPLPVERALRYMEKATKEAKSHTSWVNPVSAYDQAVRHFVESVLSDEEFLEEVEAFVSPLREPGWVNSLAQKLVQLTAPGVPDVYQGSELWDLSLVDPDNRRPVDYRLRRRLLGELQGIKAEDVWARSPEGLPKLLVVQRALRLRRRRPDLFGPQGSYLGLAAMGSKADHVVAFARLPTAKEPYGVHTDSVEQGGAVTVVPRLVLGLGAEWEDTSIVLPAAGRWRNELTGDEVDVGEDRHLPLAGLMARFPVALIVREP